MMKTVEAILEKDGRLRFLEPVELSGARRVLVTILEEANEQRSEVAETPLLSEPALGEDWNRPEEDEAWQHFQPEP